MKNFSFFQPPITNTQPFEAIDLPELYKRITGPAYRQQTETLRSMKDPKEARNYKARHFPYVTFGGCFEKRSDKQLLQPSGLLVIDLDHLEEVEAVKTALFADPLYGTELLFVSPSGSGLKWVTRYPNEAISHQEYFRALSAYLEATYALKADESGKDISRACFLSYDPHAILNEKYIIENQGCAE